MRKQCKERNNREQTVKGKNRSKYGKIYLKREENTKTEYNAIKLKNNETQNKTDGNKAQTEKRNKTITVKGRDN